MSVGVSNAQAAQPSILPELVEFDLIRSSVFVIFFFKKNIFIIFLRNDQNSSDLRTSWQFLHFT
jgi:hypothetical protein